MASFVCGILIKSNYKLSEKERNVSLFFSKRPLLQFILSATRGQRGIYFPHPATSRLRPLTRRTSTLVEVPGPSLECGPHTFGVDYFM